MKFRLVALVSFTCFALGTAAAAEPVMMSQNGPSRRVKHGTPIRP